MENEDHASSSIGLLTTEGKDIFVESKMGSYLMASTWVRKKLIFIDDCDHDLQPISYVQNQFFSIVVDWYYGEREQILPRALYNDNMANVASTKWAATWENLHCPSICYKKAVEWLKEYQAAMGNFNVKRFCYWHH